jgi:predicted nuclease of restriction endonuclease-like (RecB) superfamily
MIETTNTDNVKGEAYDQLVADAKARVQTGQLAAWRAVNKELISLYWDLGKLIVERQQQHGWGNSVVEMLAKDLQQAFPSMGGFSKTNLWRIRAFYQTYGQKQILPPPVGEFQLEPKSIEMPPAVAEIGWSHNYVIIEKCKDPNERLFYIHQTRRYGWTKNVLIHQIENQTFEKTVISQQNFEETLPESLQSQAILAVKDDYAFGFLELGDQHSEYQLEQAILQNIRQFLVEMGGDFCFIANQYPLELNGKDYRVDLLLFHRGLRALVAIDLKINEFEPEHTGKMSFYLSLLDDRTKKPHENPSIGIIICKSKDFTTVEFALKDINKPIGVATYSITTTLPKELSAFFPSPEELIQRVEAVIDAVSKKQ